MKKILSAVILFALMACGNKQQTVSVDSQAAQADSQTTQTNSQTTQTDSLAALADGVEAAPADLWTEDAVKQHVRQMYDRLNELVNKGCIDLNQMDEEFCTGYFLGLKRNIASHDADAKGDMRFHGDEGSYRWWVGVGAPLEIVSLEAELLTGNMARARVRFKTDPDYALYEEEEKGHDSMTLELWMENGRWRVNNFEDPGTFGEQGYLGMMETYARKHNIPLEDDEEPTEGAPV